MLQAFTPTFYTFVVFGVIMMVMYLATIPTVSMMVLRRKGAERYTDVSFKRIIGFLYDGYKPQYFWW